MKHRAPNIRAPGGFTLLEVLVALAVVAIALGALARVGAGALSQQADLEERTLALWVADNALTDLRLETAPAPGRRDGRTRQGGRDWRWEMEVQPAPGGELLRADVSVYPAGADDPVLSHTGFLPR